MYVLTDYIHEVNYFYVRKSYFNTRSHNDITYEEIYNNHFKQ